MDNENEQAIEDVLEDTDETESPEDGTESPAAQDKPKETPEAKLARLERQAAKVRKQLGLEDKPEPKKASKPLSDGLDETQLDYLDLKGITDSDDIKVIEKVVRTTGVTVREALKDEYVVAKLKSNQEQRDVKSATPSSTKRGASTGTTLDQALARYERDGTLPEDFKLRSEVVNSIVAKTNPNKPSWQR